MLKGQDLVELRIEEAFGNRKTALLALCNKYARDAVKTVRANQGLEQLVKGRFWTNQTSMAVKSITGSAVDDGGSVACRLVHHMEYGKWLELANDRRHAALEPTLRMLYPYFMDDLKKIYQG